MKVTQSCLTLWNPMDCSLPGSSVHRDSPGQILKWVALPFSRGSSQTSDWTQVSHIAGGFTIWATREATYKWSITFKNWDSLYCAPVTYDIVHQLYFKCVCTKSPQPCPTLCDPIDCSLPGSSVHGILQTRILEYIAIFSSRRSSQARDGTLISCVYCIGSQVLYH